MPCLFYEQVVQFTLWTFLTRATVRARVNGGGGKLIILFYSVIKGQRKVITNHLFSQVKTLKERIEEEKGKDNFSVSGLKLIYAGMLQTFYPSDILTFVDKCLPSLLLSFPPSFLCCLDIPDCHLAECI